MANYEGPARFRVDDGRLWHLSASVSVPPMARGTEGWGGQISGRLFLVFGRVVMDPESRDLAVAEARRLCQPDNSARHVGIVERRGTVFPWTSSMTSMSNTVAMKPFTPWQNPAAPVRFPAIGPSNPRSSTSKVRSSTTASSIYADSQDPEVALEDLWSSLAHRGHPQFLPKIEVLKLCASLTRRARFNETDSFRFRFHWARERCWRRPGLVCRHLVYGHERRAGHTVDMPVSPSRQAASSARCWESSRSRSSAPKTLCLLPLGVWSLHGALRPVWTPWERKVQDYVPAGSMRNPRPSVPRVRSRSCSGAASRRHRYN